MKIVYLGSGEFGVPSLMWLREAHAVGLVVTQPARPAGRGRHEVETPIAQLAHTLQLAHVPAADVNAPEVVEKIRQLRPEVLVVIAFGQKIGPELLKLPGCRVVNLHGSLLPAYRGAAPINWAIIKGERRTGVTVIELNERFDAGAILGTSELEIKPLDTAGELHDRLAELGPGLLQEVLEKLACGEAQPIPQDETKASKAPKLKKEHGAIHWNQPAEQIQRQILGMWPWPGAYCLLRQQGRESAERISIARAEAIPGPAGEPGQVGPDLTVACGTGRLRLLEVKPDNSKLMKFADFVNGHHLKSGDRFLDGEKF